MLQNSIKLNVKTKCIEEQLSDISWRRSSTLQAHMFPGSSITPEKEVNKTFLAIIAQWGYDVLLTYKTQDDAKQNRLSS